MNTEVISTRTGIGAGIGAFLGFAFGGPIGAGIGAVVGGGIAHASTGDETKGVLTPRRKLIYKRAMETVSDPDEIRTLAKAFEEEGLRGQAEMLRKRAKLRELPLSKQETRRIAFRKSMACDDPDVILKMALAFQDEGALDAAKALRDHAEAVQAAHAAGKSAKPMVGGSISAFADKLGKALVQFGPESNQAKSAARNLIQARGKTPTEALITEVIRIAVEALKVESPQADGPPGQPIEIAMPEGADAPVEEPPPAGAPAPAGVPPLEAPAVGGPSAPVEAPAVVEGVPVTDPAARPEAKVVEAEAVIVEDEKTAPGEGDAAQA
jgi:hypothetical protein